MNFTAALDRFYLAYSQSQATAQFYALAHLCYALASIAEAEWLCSVMRYFELETDWLEEALAQ